MRLIDSDDVSLHIRRQSETVLEASLASALRIDEARQGVREFMLLAVDKGGGPVEHSDVERFCLEHSSRVGVLGSFLLSTGTPDERAREALANSPVVFVSVAGHEENTEPTPESVANFSQLLLGAVSVNSAVKRLAELERGATADAAASTEDPLHSAYLALLVLYHSELEFLADGRGGRSTVAVSGSGVETAMSAGYALQIHPRDGRQERVFLPSAAEIERGISLAGTAYELSLRAERTGGDEPLARMLSHVSRQFISYYLAWADGRRHELPFAELREQFEAFVGEPHISILTGQLADFRPPQQVTFLEMLRHLRARAATADLLDALDSMVPKVQEVCLKTLADFGTLDDLAPLEPFLRSRRESLRDAALDVIGKLGGDAAALHLIQLLNTDTVPLTESVLQAIARTRSVLGLGALIDFGSGRREVELPVLKAVESCLDAVDVDAVRGDGARYLAPEVLERYVALLFDADTDPAKRLALKLAAAYQLPAGVEYIEKALADESLVTRLRAIQVVPLVASDRLVQAMTDSLASLPEDYETQKLVTWMTTNLGVRHGRDGPAGELGATSDLDLHRAVATSLSKVDSDLARARLEELPAAVPDDESGDAEQHDWQSVPLMNSVFACPNGLTIWVAHSTREREADGVAFATLIHGNTFDDAMRVPEAANMLSGGMSMTQGTETEILEDVVFPCLRGEQPRFPTSVGMGEFVRTTVEGGKTVVEDRTDLHDPDSRDRAG
ncbi:hypothetical protein Phou_021710 [Phytohabitans houttuyneae]|uniref:HEAT repeat domain-containing protein n=2 Tax=Phytohabitans houttuyneae TaxID=1076126 RepID=A0A6V8K6E5_9ACTN|nr:hypothetical protein Phou_021710 [Phytohabitans houttuyneae]